MKHLSIILILSLLFGSCVKEEGVDFTIMHTPEAGVLVSQYGAYMPFCTNPDTAILIEPYKATIQGSFSCFGAEDTILRYGHVWSSNNPFPTLQDSVSVLYDATNVDTFTSTARNLKILTNYYVRSYVVTKSGRTGYNPFIMIFKTTSDTNIWILKNPTITNRGRYGAVTFTIGKYGFMGTGSDGLAPRKDFWKYDAVEEKWTQVADLLGPARVHAVAFSIGSNGYVITGDNSTLPDQEELSYCYRYNSEQDFWQRLKKLEGPIRANAVAFSFGTKGYLGLGDFKGNPLRDFWEYDPSLETVPGATPWIPIADFPGGARSNAIAFTIDIENVKIAFVGLGEDENGNYRNDIWSFSPENISWGNSETFPGAPRIHAVAFGVDDEGYIATGMMEDSTHLNDLWKYNIAQNKWIRKADFSGEARRQAVGFSLINRGFVATGITRTNDFKNDLWEYLLDSVRVVPEVK